MRIEETNIPDIDKNNIDESKVKLFNLLIKEIKPLLDENHIKKMENINSLKIQYKEKREKVINSKLSLEKLVSTYNIKKKTKKLLDKISELNSSSLIHDGLLKREITILLKVIDTLDSNKLDYHLYEITKIAKKRFLK